MRMHPVNNLDVAGGTFHSTLCAAPSTYAPRACIHPQDCGGATPLVIFSHRGALGLPSDSPVVTERSLIALAHSGVPAADLDLFWTRDRTLFVGHPVAMAAHLSVADVFALSTDELELRSPGVLRGSRLLELAAGGLNLTVALDVKGQERPGYGRQLERLSRQIRSHQLESTVWMWVWSARVASRLRGSLGSLSASKRPPLVFIKPLRDVGAPARDGQSLCSSQINASDGEEFVLLGPSRACANPTLLDAAPGFHTEGSMTVMPRWSPFASRWLTWTVDEPHELQALLRLGVRYIITNRPLAQLRFVSQLRAAVCQPPAAQSSRSWSSPPPPLADRGRRRGASERLRRVE
uniref:GP-PDE domain-containing protein n=1 Tax=Calcidiscus leptoporus TaxID=127549 RepID=A0A7S0JAN7_9EUKA|mmetsp:Transcript_48326/g.111862  ORF Transcript_48326/g.111862 Transcript_48326/m.111862 type:complete len:350 (+) Transcript_48326:20-1069(+)